MPEVRSPHKLDPTPERPTKPSAFLTVTAVHFHQFSEHIVIAYMDPKPKTPKP